MRNYEHLREGMTDTKCMDKVLTRLGIQHDGTTAAIVTMAALDTPPARVAELIGIPPSEVDAIVSRFSASVRRALADEKNRSAA